jgi:hypothetical protein
MDIRNSVLFLGDVAPYRPYRFKTNCKTVINLECPITDGGVPASDKIILGAKENHLQSIFNSSLLCVNLSNNHILDYGRDGLESTVKELEKAGINYFGLNSKKENNPEIINFNGYRIAFLSAVCESTSPLVDYDEVNYISQLDPDEIIQKISSVRKKADRIVVYLHLGEEESSCPAIKDIKTARLFIDKGADIVIGSHAHSPQAVEQYKYGIIAHNLGNFIMPEMKNVPSYFDEKGVPGTFFNSRTMLWNRISWGVMIDIVTMEFRIKKFIFLRNRVVELPFTPYDNFLKLPRNVMGEGYEKRVARHKKLRRMQRRIIEFIYDPHVPQKLKRKS